MKEERLQRKSEGSEVLSWVNKLGKIEDERREERKKALLRSKIFEEQVRRPLYFTPLLSFRINYSIMSFVHFD